MNYRDEWFTKPLLFKSDTGRWLCTTTRADEWRATGNGVTPTEAYEDMKSIIVAAYKRIASRVTFVYDR